MTDHLQMKGKDALTIEEAEAVLSTSTTCSDYRYQKAYHRAYRKLRRGAAQARTRRDTREGMRKLGADAAEKAGVKIVKEEG